MSAKTKAPYQPPVDDSDDDCDCPKCPPVGAPAWLATFADIATNLMAFFVLILGFANFDEPSFKKFAGAMREQFGVGGLAGQSGDTIIDLAPLPDHDDSEFDESAPGNGAASGDAEQNARAVADALRDALAAGSLTVETGSGTVTVRLPDVQGPEAALALADVIAAAAGGSVERQPKPGKPLPGEDPASRAHPAPGATADAGQPDTAADQTDHPHHTDTVGDIRAKLSAMVMQTVLEEQIADGSLSVELRDGKLLVTLGAGGSFESGSATLSDEARAVMARIASASNRPDRRIIVTGHTDNVPVTGGQYADNLDLSAARAASVVRELVETDRVDPASISAMAKGEYAPVADNATEEGRARNRRIEIEITFDG